MNENKAGLSFSKSEGEISRRDFLKRLSPFGRVEIDASACSGCGLCALECPTGALMISSDEVDAFQLIFKPRNCLACNCCAEVCPEGCLHMERVLDVDEMNKQQVLLEDVIIRCSRCDRAIGPKAMIDRLKARLSLANHDFPGHFELCPNCKVEAQFGQLRTQEKRYCSGL